MAQRAVQCMRFPPAKGWVDPRSHRPSRIPTDGARFDERLFVVLCDVVDVRGNRCWWLVAVDQHTDFSVIAPCPSHESQAVAKHIFKHWTRWAGPLGVLVCDGERGLGASEIFKKKKKRKTLCVRDSGANHSSLFSVAEGSSRAKDRNYQGSGGQDDFATPSDKENQRGREVGRTKETSWQDVSSFGRPREKPLEEHAASEAIRRAAAACSRPTKTFEPGTFCFFHRQCSGKRAETAMRGRYLGLAALIGPHGRSCWWVTFARLNT